VNGRPRRNIELRTPPDVHYIHRFDAETPVEETMAALDDLLRVGKVRYLGGSSMWAWQFAKLQHFAARGGWTSFSAVQDQYNVLKRGGQGVRPGCRQAGGRRRPARTGSAYGVELTL
jgi:aryl-alcohol dehydrogenase-like predicted oxidoreductase